MKNKLVAILVALFVLVLAGTTLNAQESKKEKSCAGGCCGNKSMAMVDPKGASPEGTSMQDHSKHQQEQSKKDTTAKEEKMKMSKS